MKLELLPLLQTQCDLYAVPRGPARFEAYIEALTGGGDEVVLPLANLNPMGKEHVAALVDSLLARDAEAGVAEVLAAAENRLAGLENTPPNEILKVGLVLTDDLAGGWTNRYLTDMTGRFKNLYDVAHGLALVPIWTSEGWDDAALERAVLSTVYRALYKKNSRLAGHACGDVEARRAGFGLCRGDLGARARRRSVQPCGVAAVPERHRVVGDFALSLRRRGGAGGRAPALGFVGERGLRGGAGRRAAGCGFGGNCATGLVRKSVRSPPDLPDTALTLR